MQSNNENRIDNGDRTGNYNRTVNVSRMGKATSARSQWRQQCFHDNRVVGDLPRKYRPAVIVSKF